MRMASDSAAKYGDVTGGWAGVEPGFGGVGHGLAVDLGILVLLLLTEVTWFLVSGDSYYYHPKCLHANDNYIRWHPESSDNRQSDSQGCIQYVDSDVSAISKIQNCTRVIDMSAKSPSRIRTGSFDMHVAQL